MLHRSYIYLNNENLIELVIIRKFQDPFGKCNYRKYIRHFTDFNCATTFQSNLH
jgi:hypothetical protein